jgi:hypothetical protein
MSLNLNRTIAGQASDVYSIIDQAFTQASQKVQESLSSSSVSVNTSLFNSQAINLTIVDSQVNCNAFIVQQNASLELISTVGVDVSNLKSMILDGLTNCVNALTTLSSFNKTVEGAIALNNVMDKIHTTIQDQQTTNSMISTIQGITAGQTLNITIGPKVTLNAASCIISQSSALNVVSQSLVATIFAPVMTDNAMNILLQTLFPHTSTDSSASSSTSSSSLTTISGAVTTTTSLYVKIVMVCLMIILAHVALVFLIKALTRRDYQMIFMYTLIIILCTVGVYMVDLLT